MIYTNPKPSHCRQKSLPFIRAVSQQLYYWAPTGHPDMGIQQEIRQIRLLPFPDAASSLEHFFSITTLKDWSWEKFWKEILSSSLSFLTFFTNPEDPITLKTVTEIPSEKKRKYIKSPKNYTYFLDKSIITWRSVFKYKWKTHSFYNKEYIKIDLNSGSDLPVIIKWSLVKTIL